MSALVHYLFHEPQLGGTVFFKSLMSEADTQTFLIDATTLDGPAFASKYAITPAYMTQSNPYFEVIGRMAPRWNRAVFYDGSIFHSGDIQNNNHQAYLNGIGRLTLNAFFKSSKIK